MLVATDGADVIEPGRDGRSLRVVWRRWALVGAKSGELVEPQITSEVNWQLDGATLTRTETLTADANITLRRWWVTVPTTATQHEAQLANGARSERFTSDEGTLTVSTTAAWPLHVSLSTPGNGALGRGARMPLPLHLVYETHNLRLVRGQSARWRITLKAEGKQS